MPNIRANGITLHYEEHGPKNAPPLVIINGYSSQMTSWPDDLHEAFVARGYHVIRFDNRDTGLSHKFDGILPDVREVMKAVAEGRKPDVPYALNDMADDAAALLDALGIKSAHVAGASMGGMIAQLVAIRHPDKVRSLISIMSTTSEPSLPRSTPEAQEALLARPPSEAKHDVVEHSIKGRRAYSSPLYPDDEDFLRMWIGKNYDRMYYPQGAVRQYAAIMASPPRTEMLKKLRTRTLVLHGAADTLIRPDAGRHTAECIPGAELRIVEGWGHNFPRKAIPMLVGIMGDFIDKVEKDRDEAFSRPVTPGCCGERAGQ
jgi:pimeloyl-ACP methyl ester carboxylesterase